MKKYTIKRQAVEIDISSMSIDYANKLNPAQLSAVTFGKGASLIIAGAGSGKTRTLVYRVAYLVERGIPPTSILLLTFTRKAAQEMLKRAAALTSSRIDSQSGGVEGGTFHSFASRVLREFAQEIGFSPTFTILDRSDSEDVINLIRGRMGLNVRGRRFPKKKTISNIFSKSVSKSSSMSGIVETEFPHFSKEIEPLYELFSGYTEYKQKHMLMDYDDLLVYLVRLLKESGHVAAKLRSRYAYVLVDEYQDTNSLQADIVKYLVGDSGNVMVVGDDSQSIYSFRGADFRNIMDFPELFPKSKIIKLEENYRSTQSILKLANTIIDRAREKYTKVLFTKRKKGHTPALVPLPDESVQSVFVAQKILELREEGVALDDIAVLFRAGFHSFDLEIELKKRNIPYVKHGGFKFMETAHVKDIMAHLKIIVNPSDAVGLERTLLLVDGVGPTAARKIAEQVVVEGVTSKGLLNYTNDKRYGEGITKLAKAISTLENSQMSPADAITLLTDYYTPLLKKKFDDYPKRLQDLEHLAIITGKYKDFDSFVTDMALDPPTDSISDILREDPDPERLILSTIHSAKGLEWHSVFVIWAAEGYFPTTYAAESVEDIEEELRLIYVAMTRAEENLFITYPVKIITHRGPAYGKASRFVQNISEEILETWVVEEEWSL